MGVLRRDVNVCFLLGRAKLIIRSLLLRDLECEMQGEAEMHLQSWDEPNLRPLLGLLHHPG